MRRVVTILLGVLLFVTTCLGADLALAVVGTDTAIFTAPAGDAVPQIAEPTAADAQAFLHAIGGLRGASAMAITLVAVQGLMLLLRSHLGEKTGAYRFIVLTFLTFVGGIVSLRVSGLDWASCLMHSQTLAALQVFGNQAYKQLATSKGLS